ncbi:alpha/beta hydrolase [Actinoallomurus bryophytorum]|uniref:Acetyl esterase/lipase n=1 Tax=Actinoallomurus bryophytorum TaxID=1490222 RepID=A0A543C1B2_9ACTN|nr:alpha/beta hydrolase [Actinoallomurus bryophytorum]TQL90861.1 acetyl esterase/lipase [Actinoallomurus bryophytorum]
MPYVLLASGVLALLTAANAIRPRRGLVLLIPGFFAAWLTIELAPWVLTLEVLVTALLLSWGGLDGLPGWLGLAATVAGWAGLAVVMIRARRTTLTVREAGAELELDPGERAPAFPRSQVIIPFLMTRRRGVTRVRDIAYGDDPVMRLDVYKPSEPGGLRPGIMEVHGGAWLVGSKREQGIPLLNHLAANGWVGINVDYRLSPRVKFPDHLIDLKRAIRWYREHAEEHGADPDFLCVTGGSAGGHLAALVALTANVPDYQPGFTDVDTSVRAAVPFYGVYDMSGLLDRASRRFASFLERHVMGTTRADDPEAYDRASPVHWVREDAPPFLIVHGDLDTLVPVAQARSFTERLRRTSAAPVLYAEMKGAQHAFDLFPSYRAARVIEGTERFLTSVRRTERRQVTG